MTENENRTTGVNIGVKLGAMAQFGENIGTRQAVDLCDQLRAEIEKLQTQPKTEGEQMQLFAHFTTIKHLINVDVDAFNNFRRVLDTMQYINECEEVAKRDIIAYIKTH